MLNNKKQQENKQDQAVENTEEKDIAEDNATNEAANQEEQVNYKDLLEKKEKEAADYLNRLQRTMAEFDNFRKRTQKEKSMMYENGAKEILEAILPVIDNFERALQSSEEDKENAVYKGVEMIYKQLTSVLENIGVKPIDAVGNKFDPNFHNAVTHAEDDAYGENEIVEEFQKGYIYKDSVLRYSMVKVVN